MLAASQPPADFPIPEAGDVPAHIRPLMNEVAGLNKRREKLESEVRKGGGNKGGRGAKVKGGRRRGARG